MAYELSKEDEALVDLLWNYLKKDPEDKERRLTSYGTKTKFGLARSIEEIIKENKSKN